MSGQGGGAVPGSGGPAGNAGTASVLKLESENNPCARTSASTASASGSSATSTLPATTGPATGPSARPRGLEDPAHRVEDIKAAVSFLTTRDEADPDRIGMLGICASGRYGLAAAATDHRIRAVATVSAVDIARQFREGADGTQDPAVIQGMLDTAAAARTAEARGEGTRTFKLFPDTEEEARRGGPYVFEGWEYYCTQRAAHPRSAKALTWSSIDRIVTFDAFRAVDLIAPRPLLMIAGREAVTSWLSVQALQQARGPKELLWIDGAVHNDLYDKEQDVGPAITKLTGFFTENLAADTPAEATPARQIPLEAPDEQSAPAPAGALSSSNAPPTHTFAAITGLPLGFSIHP